MFIQQNLWWKWPMVLCNLIRRECSSGEKLYFSNYVIISNYVQKHTILANIIWRSINEFWKVCVLQCGMSGFGVEFRSSILESARANVCWLPGVIWMTFPSHVIGVWKAWVNDGARHLSNWIVWRFRPLEIKDQLWQTTSNTGVLYKWDKC